MERPKSIRGLLLLLDNLTLRDDTTRCDDNLRLMTLRDDTTRCDDNLRLMTLRDDAAR